MLIGVIAGLIGLSFGMFGVLAFRVSEQQRQLVDVDVDDPSLPDGAAEVLAVLGRAFVVVDAIDGVVRASPAAYAYGLVRGHTVVHQQLLELTAKVRRDGVILEKQLELPRGPLGQGTIVVQVRAAVITEEYILLLADDRTEFTRTEEVRNDFVANVSHELKTPVGAISPPGRGTRIVRRRPRGGQTVRPAHAQGIDPACGPCPGHHRTLPAPGRQCRAAGPPGGHQHCGQRGRGPLPAAGREQEHPDWWSAGMPMPWSTATRTCSSPPCAT